jgi:hypothetical protein
MVYNTQNHWVSELCPSYGILRTRNLVLETESVSIIRRGEGGDTYSVRSHQKELT